MYIVVYVTAKDVAEAQKIAEGLVQARLVACSNIVKDIKSVFWWEGKVDQSDEALLILKSKKNLLPKIIQMVKALHSYSLPEIIAMPIIDGSKDYLKWIEESCLPGKKK